MSTTLACVFGSAPNAVDALEKIFDCVDNCACVSKPMTISQCICARLDTCRQAPVPVRGLLILGRGAEQLPLLEIIRHELQANRPVLCAESAGNTHAGYPGQTGGNGIQIRQ